MRRMLMCLLGVMVCVSAAHASETATVVGRVKDESGAVLAGATVTARNTSTGVARSGVTAADGSYRIPALLPGAYEVTAEMSGFGSARRTGLTLNLGAEVAVDFNLGLSGRTEEVTVVADAPLVETTNSAVQKIINREQIDVLPLIGRDVSDLARLSPGVAVTANGYNFTGSRERANAYVIDGVDNAEDISGFSRQDFNLDGVQEFQVLINNFKAEYGRADGGVISVLTRSGTNQFRGGAFFLFRNTDMIARSPFEEPDAPKDPFERMQWGGHIGGPIVKDRTHFFASFDYQDRETFSDITAPYPRPGAPMSAATAAFLRQHNVPAFPDTSGGTTVRLVRDEFVRLPKVALRLDHALSQTQSLVFRVNYERDSEPSGFNGTVYDANGATAYFRTAYGNLNHKWIVRNNHLNELYLQVGETRGNWFVHFPTLTNVFIDEFSTGTAWLGGPTNYPQGRTDKVYQVIDNYTIHLPNSAGSHVIKLGGDAKIFRSESFFDSNFRGSYFFRTVDDFLAGRPRRFTQNQGDTKLDRPNNIFGVYVQDDWTISRKLTLNLGLRYDYENGKTEALRGVPDGSAACALTRSCGDAGPGISGDKNNIAPRFGFVWDPWGDGRTAVHGGAGVYYDQVILNIQGNARFTPPKVIGVQIENPTFPDPFQGGSRATLRPNISVIDPELVTPRAFNTSFGVKRELTQDLAVDATFIYKRGTNQVAIININSIDPATRVRPNANFTNVSFYTNEGDIKYRGLLLEITKRMSNNYSFSLSYTLSKNENETETFVGTFQDPRNLALNLGPSDEDRRHTLVGHVLARLPWDLELGSVFEYRSARPIDVFAGGIDLNGDGITGDWPAGYSRNSVYQLSTAEANRLRAQFGRAPIGQFTHNPSFFNVDMTVQKSFRMGGNRKLRMTAELFNAFNWANYLKPTGNITSVSFGQRTDLDTSRDARPRSLQLTAQFEF